MEFVLGVIVGAGGILLVEIAIAVITAECLEGEKKNGHF